VVVEGIAGNALLMRVVEIGALNHAGEHPSAAPESTVVDALADALLQIRSRKTQ